MILVVYKRPDGDFVAMPYDSPARMHLSATYGRLVLCTHVTVDELEEEAVREKVVADIANHSYSIIDQAIARRLVSLTCDSVQDPT